MKNNIERNDIKIYRKLIFDLGLDVIHYDHISINGEDQNVITKKYKKIVMPALKELLADSSLNKFHYQCNLGKYIMAYKVLSSAEEFIGIVYLILAKKPSSKNLLLIEDVVKLILNDCTNFYEKELMLNELEKRNEEISLVYTLNEFVEHIARFEESFEKLTQKALLQLDLILCAVYIPKKRIFFYSSNHIKSPSEDETVEKICQGIYLYLIENNCDIVEYDSLPKEVKKPININDKYLVKRISTHHNVDEGLFILLRDKDLPNFTNSDKAILQTISDKISKVLNLHYDALTGLLNRNGFQHYLDSAYTEFNHDNIKLYSIFIISLTNLKIINETIDFSAGDKIICHVANMLITLTALNATVARLDGDKFAMLIPNITESEAEKYAEVCLSKLKENYAQWATEKIPINACIGATNVSGSHTNSNDIMQTAIMACQTAKELGPNHIQFFHQDQSEYILMKQELSIIKEFHDSLNENRLVLYCQPIVHVDKFVKKIKKYKYFEVLVRIKKPNKEILTPDNFIPYLEKYNLMSVVDLAIFKKLIESINAHANNINLSEYKWAVNISGHSFSDPDISNKLIAALESSILSPSNIIIEITERQALHNYALAKESMQMLKKYGFEFSLDDFGTGISSFDYLRNLDVSAVKIDGSFIKNLDTDKISLEIVNAVNNIAHMLGIYTVAEYVNSKKVADILINVGIDYLQGYYISKPVALEQTLNELSG